MFILKIITYRHLSINPYGLFIMDDGKIWITVITDLNKLLTNEMVLK